MRNHRLSVVLPFLFLLTACAGNRVGSTPPDGYVEIENPAFTMSKDAPATIWVPRSYVESGVPRGSELLKKGYEAVKQGATGNAPAHPVINEAPQATVNPPAVKSRIVALEMGQNRFLPQFREKLKSASVGILLEPDLGSIASFGSITSQEERLSLSKRLSQDLSSNLVLFIIAPDQIAPGKKFVVEIHDGMGGGVLREVDAIIPAYDAADQAARASAVASALAGVTGKVKEVVALVPWYGRIVAIDGERVYINAGKEAGVTIGQDLKIFRGGKFVAGLGFAPGEMIGTLKIQGFAGPNGAYGVVKDGQRVRVSDMVATE
ncbi:hypothetical protein KI811_15995 [Geobacter hydrogenophilus]|uniref:Flagellar assembly protein T C-terminal domain-containing protein n=1 Tax=Geobacter hydrogenophilus TaxID=40983 RepID=A0A9W6LD49_9BACT|nr:hypothetical protein [Geobacter hydrogenophilus]MBT0895310.1 hypothetical protein [Geobacter hydrogenophilus]GLI39537.1 hypothetical protein GHYDROH2_30380 [Geobacter hydrogenophilus]